jgi:hypothetical protein
MILVDRGVRAGMTGAGRTSHGSFGKRISVRDSGRLRPGASAPASSDPAAAGRRLPVPEPPRLPLPVIGVLAISAFALRHGKYRLRHWSLMRWALPLARLAAPLRTPVLMGLIAALTVVSTWFGLYLLVITGWAP